MVTPTDGPQQNHANRHNPTNQQPRPSFRAALSPPYRLRSVLLHHLRSRIISFSPSLSLSLSLSSSLLFSSFLLLSSLRRFFVISHLYLRRSCTADWGFFHRYPLFILFFILPRPFVSLFFNSRPRLRAYNFSISLPPTEPPQFLQFLFSPYYFYS